MVYAVSTTGAGASASGSTTSKRVPVPGSLSTLIDRRIVEKQDEALAPTLKGKDQALELAGQIAVFLEGYAALAEVAQKLSAGPRAEKEIAAEALTVAQRQAMEGRIRRAEAASQLTLQNGLKVLLDLGLVVRAEGGRIALGPEGVPALAAFRDELLTTLKPLS